MANNPCARMRTKDNPYEIWQSPDGKWKYLVLRKYKKAVTSEYDRWYCCTISPMTPQGEFGDTYAETVMRGTTKTFDCFAKTHTDEQSNVQGAKILIVQALTDDVTEHFTVTDLKPRARVHKQYQIDLPAGCVHTISKERSIVGPIEFYDCQDGRVIVIDHAWQQVNAYMKKQENSNGHTR